MLAIPHRLRLNTYVDIRHASLAGLEGSVNTVSGAPADGSSLNEVKRALFGTPGVATVLGLAESVKSVQDAFDQISGVFLIVELFVLGLALLIAFNADERACDHATMFAYGVPARRAVSNNLAVEGLVVGILATIPGTVSDTPCCCGC